MNRTTKSTNCDAAVNGNQGCGVQVNKWSSYGPGFNNNGGGIYAMERTNEYIKVFFWPRNDDSLPLDIRSKSNVINTDNWVHVFLNRTHSNADHFSSPGIACGVLPQHSMQHRTKVRTKHYYYQSYSLCVILRVVRTRIANATSPPPW